MVSNIILVTIDCLRYDRCGFNGYHRPTTPVLSQLAQDSTIWDRAYASGPYTPESFTGILAGRSGRNSPYLDDRALSCLPNNSPTLASEMRDLGFDTIAVVANPQLSAKRHFSNGFRYYENLRTNELRDDSKTVNENRDNETNNTRRKAFLSGWISSIFRKIKDNDDLPLWITGAGYSGYRFFQMQTDWPIVNSVDVINRFCTVIKSRGSRSHSDSNSRGFFAWTHLNDLHAPIHPTLVRNSELNPGVSVRKLLMWDAARASQSPKGQYDQMYDAALRHIDAQIGTLIDRLKQLGVWDETVLIVTSDHGEAFYERGVWGHQQHYLYDEVLHVPMLIRDPESQESRTEGLFSLAWLHEMIADLAGVDRFNLPITSCVPEFAAENDDRIIVSDSITQHGHTVSTRNSEFKLIKHYDSQTDTPERALGGLHDEELYRIRSDRGEHIPIDANYVPADLLKFANRIRTHIDEMTPVDDLSSGNELGTERQEQLQDLGYL